MGGSAAGSPLPPASDGADRRPTLSAEQAFGQSVPGQPEVLGNVTQNGSERADSQGSVPRQRQVMLPVLARGQSEMATCLACRAVAEISEGLREIVARDVPRQSQAVMTSSRTK
jgi:hypothetical protein